MLYFTTMALTAEQRDWLSLVLVPGVGSTYFIRLLARFRSPTAVLHASPAALREVVGPQLADRIVHYKDVVDLDAQERRLAEYDASLVTLEDSPYPPSLAEIYDPPLALFVRGQLLDQDEHCVAIVGTRRASAYGQHVAERLGRELAERGVTVVSGMAAGVDSAAHRGAIEAGGRTIAVLGCGVDIVYPKQNAQLMQSIIESGAVVSQFPMGIKPSKGHFPFRNRIISGMTLGTVIVEAPVSSGALITARHAADQGREVFAVPGRIGDANSAGPHALIREGAKLTESIDDILIELDVPATARKRPVADLERPAAQPVTERTVAAAPQRTPPSLSERERDLLSVLAPNGSFVDEIAAACRMSVAETLSSLTMLELKGCVLQYSGKRFAPRV